MPIVIDDASAVAGVIALSVTLLNGCIKGFAILCRARECDRSVASVRLMLELQQHKFFTWAEEVGLLEDPPQLRIPIQDWECATAILRSLEELLEDVQKLKSKYALRIEETLEELDDVQNDPALDELQVRSRFRTPKWQQATRRAFRTRAQPWRRLKWVAVDEQHFRQLLNDVSYFTTELQRYLDEGKRQDLQTRHDILVRSTIINTTSQLALELIGSASTNQSTSSAVAATARVKKKRLKLGFLNRLRRSSSEHESNPTHDSSSSLSLEVSQISVTNSPHLGSRRLSSRLLTLSELPLPSQFRQLAYYKDQPVILEWRAIMPNMWKRMQDRVERLSSLLFELDDPSFHSLPCRGYVVNHDAGRYGYVFNIPPTNKFQQPRLQGSFSQPNHFPALPGMHTLRHLLEKRQSVPSLNLRLSYAIVLLETVLQLHTAGWLHKEMRPDNILFLPSGDCQHPYIPETSMYLAGYAYARADDSHDFTEPAQESIEAQLYRHPLSLGNQRFSYRKSFDLFSVGCILLEIGLWSSMCDFLSSYTLDNHNNVLHNGSIPATKTRLTPPQSPKAGRLNGPVQLASEDRNLIYLRRNMLENLQSEEPGARKIQALVEAQAGRQYAKVAIDCLQADSFICDATAIDAERYTLEFEEKSVRTLQALAEIL